MFDVRIFFQSIGKLTTAVLIAGLLFLPVLSAASEQVQPAGRVINFKGLVRVIPVQGAGEILPAAGLILNTGAVVLTGADGWVSILMSDETLIQLNRNTRFTLKSVDFSAGWHRLKKIIPVSAPGTERSVYQMDTGEIWLRNKNPEARIRLQTPTVSAGIRGTEINAAVGDDDSVILSILEGRVEAHNEYGSLTAGPGEMIYTARGSAPKKRMLISPRDAVQWTLVLPPVDIRYAYPMVSNDVHFLKSEQIRLSADIKKNPTNLDSLLALAQIYRDLNRFEDSQKIFDALSKEDPENSSVLTGLGWIAIEQGHLEHALNLFQKVQTSHPMTMMGIATALARTGDFETAQSIVSLGSSIFPEQAGFFLLQAEIKLAMRDLITAEQLLRVLTRTKPDYGPGWSLLSIVMLARGDVDPKAALAAAENGVKSSTDSPAAFLTLSYACQAAFDLESAMKAAENAIRIDPGYIPAIVTKAGLLFGANRTREAFNLIESAFRQTPKAPGILNLRGFLQLADRKMDAAEISFNSALDADPGMGEAHLGLALISMRRGNVARAMEEISTAVLLEPQRSIFVSYWAKMLYQMKRFDRALQALEYAKTLDPMDPTPFLYEAIILRDLNRPTEAVAAIQEAVRLNDNRAVYRSRFLLDRDLAVKNIDQTILFQDLGLMDWARSKALASVKTDYHNSAAHTFLAGSLLSMEDRLRSGSSENLLGLMLQQANLNSLNTFQDYTTFFETPGINGILSGIYGNHDTRKGNAIVYGAIPSANTAFNAIVDYSKTSGWRDTNSSRIKGAGLSLKWDPSPEDGFTLLASHSTSTARDRQRDPYEYNSPSSPEDRQETFSNSVTLGYRRNLRPETDLLLMVKHSQGQYDSSGHDALWLDTAREFVLFQTYLNFVDLSSDHIQAQMLYHHNDHQLIFGLLHQWRRRGLNAESLNEYWGWYDGWWYDLGTETDTYDHTVNDWYQSAYIQDIWKLTPWLTLETALYYDSLKNHNLFSGVAQRREKINPRLGVVLTPTDHDTIRIAGFRYLTPFTIDRLDPTDIAGIPLFRNNFENTVTEEYDLAFEHDWSSGYIATTLFYLKSETEENHASGLSDHWSARIKGIEPVWNQMLWQGVGLSIRYRFLDIENEYASDKDRKDHLASITLKYLHPNGFFAGISQSFRNENFNRSTRDTEHIWLTDLTLGYKFPDKRGGIRIDVKNLFDHRFNWVVDDMVFSGRIPSREILASFSVTF